MHCFDATHGWKGVEIAQYIKNFFHLFGFSLFSVCRLMKFFFFFSNTILALQQKIKNSRRGYEPMSNSMHSCMVMMMQKIKRKKTFCSGPNNLLLTLALKRLVANFVHNRFFLFFFYFFCCCYLHAPTIPIRARKKKIFQTSACKWNQFFVSLENESEQFLLVLCICVSL